MCKIIFVKNERLLFFEGAFTILNVIDGLYQTRKKVPGFFSIEKNEAIFIFFQHKKSKNRKNFAHILSLSLSLSPSISLSLSLLLNSHTHSSHIPNINIILTEGQLRL
jgi:hypothetical protein